MKPLLSALALGLLCACEPATTTPGVERLREDGRMLVINYWARWCAPCREEIPELNRFAARQAGRARVYAVNFDGVRGADLLRQAEALGIGFALLEEDPAARLGYARPTALPSTLFVAARGEVAARLLGSQTVGSLEAALDEAITQ